MRWLGSFVGEEQVIRKFAFIASIKVKSNLVSMFASIFINLFFQ